MKIIDKNFLFGFACAALLAFIAGSFPFFDVPYDSGIRCIKAPCPQGKVSLLKYPEATKIAIVQFQEQISKLIEENNRLEVK
jgi:hypothetical protein